MSNIPTTNRDCVEFLKALKYYVYPLSPLPDSVLQLCKQSSDAKTTEVKNLQYFSLH